MLFNGPYIHYLSYNIYLFITHWEGIFTLSTGAGDGRQLTTGTVEGV